MVNKARRANAWQAGDSGEEPAGAWQAGAPCWPASIVGHLNGIISLRDREPRLALRWR